MNVFTIKSNDGKILYKGQAGSVKTCIEDAIAQNICLENANLKYLNLSNVNLDGGQLRNTDFSGSNLSGANLSEADLSHGTFNNCELYNACLVDSLMDHTDFQGASFGATDISGSVLRNSKFSTLSCFSLEFIHAKTIRNCIFKAASGQIHHFSKAPIVIKGYAQHPIVLFENTALHGHNSLDPAKFIAILGNRPPPNSLRAASG